MRTIVSVLVLMFVSFVGHVPGLSAEKPALEIRLSQCAAYLAVVGAMHRFPDVSERSTQATFEAMRSFRWNQLGHRDNSSWDSYRVLANHTTATPAQVIKIGKHIRELEKSFYGDSVDESNPDDQLIIAGQSFVGREAIERFLEEIDQMRLSSDETMGTYRQAQAKQMCKWIGISVACFAASLWVPLAALPGVIFNFAVIKVGLNRIGLYDHDSLKRRELFDATLEQPNLESWYFSSRIHGVVPEFVKIWDNGAIHSGATYPQANHDMDPLNSNRLRELRGLYIDELLSFQENEDGELEPVLHVIVRLTKKRPPRPARTPLRDRVPALRELIPARPATQTISVGSGG